MLSLSFNPITFIIIIAPHIILNRSRSPRRRSRTPPRSRSQERAERERRQASEREREREDTARDEEDYEERMRQRKQRIRDKAYKEVRSTKYCILQSVCFLSFTVRQHIFILPHTHIASVNLGE